MEGSSKTLPSEEVCKRFASTEKGASPLLSFAIGIWCFSANSISFVLLDKSHSLHGAITLISGFSAYAAVSYTHLTLPTIYSV